MKSIYQRLIHKIWIDTNLKSFVKKGVSGTILIEGIAKLLLFAITLMLTHLLPVEDYGRYSFFMASVLAIASLGTLGYDDYLVRSIRSGGEARTSVSLFMLCAIMSLVLSGYWITIYTDVNTIYHLLLVLSTALLTLQYLLSGLLKGYKHVLSAQLPEQIIRPLFFLLFLTCCTLSLLKLDLFIVVQAIFFSIAMSTVGAMILLIRKEKPRAVFIFRRYSFSWSWDMFYFAALTFFGVLRHKLDVLILGFLDLHNATAVYNVASKLSDLILVGLVLTNAVYMPLFAEQKDAPQKELLQKVLESSLIINLLIGTIIFVLFLLAGPWVLNWFGSAYVDGYAALIILSISTLVYALIGPYIIMLMMVGLERQVLLGLICGIVIQIALCLLLLKGQPVVGMAIAKGISIIFIQLIMLAVAWKKLGLKPIILQWIQRKIR
ncbi:MAG: oligosaccharide flippase family protein [Bacteroidia bacterium]|nr:oligosaccharide flippase family protein [Bacteroidia bacterium]